MPAREQAKEKHLAAIRETDVQLASHLEMQTPQTISLAHDALKQTEKAGHDPSYLALELREGLDRKTFSDENLPQILPVLQQTATAGHDPRNLALVLEHALHDNKFSAQNLQPVLSVLQKTAAAGHDSHRLAWALETLLNNKTLNAKRHPLVLGMASRHAEKGKDPVAFASALVTDILPTPENLKALKEAEPHVLHAYDLLHGVETREALIKISGPLFAYVLRTWKKNPALLEKEAFWKSAKIHVKQLKALKTNLKPA